jgi:hypothetical protein
MARQKRLTCTVGMINWKKRKPRFRHILHPAFRINIVIRILASQTRYPPFAAMHTEIWPRYTDPEVLHCSSKMPSVL